MTEELETVRNEISDFLKKRDDKGNSLLHYVARSDYKELARQLIVAGSDVNVKNNDGDSPLALAQVEMVKIFLNSGANDDNAYLLRKEEPLQLDTVRNEISDFLKIRDDKGNSLLHYVVKSDYEELARQLIIAGCDVNVKNNDGDPPMALAIKQNQIEMVKILLNSGANYDNAYFSFKEGPLYLATSYGFPEIVQLFIERGLDVNSRSFHQGTPLHCLRHQSGNQLKIAKMLVDAGADVNAMDNINYTPLTNAVRTYLPEVFEFLLSKGADVRREGKFDFEYLFTAVTNPGLDILKRLIELGFDVNMKDDRGRSCLHEATFYSDSFMIEFLLKNNAQIDVNNYGEDPLTYAFSSWLIGYSQLSEAKDNYDEEIEHGIYQRFYRRQMEIINLLINYGSNVNHVTTYEMTSLYIVIKYYNKQHSNFVRVLLKNGATFDFKHLLVRHMLNNYRNSKIPLLLFRHTALFEARNRKDGPANFDVNDLNARSQKDNARCRDELELMKSSKIADTNVSFFNVLVDRDIGPYARNESIINAFEESDVSKRFPIYEDLLCDRFSKEAEHQMLLKKAVDGLAHILNWDRNSMVLPLGLVVQFLDKKDLTNLALI